MDRKGIDVRVLSLSTPSVYAFPLETRAAVCREQNDSMLRMVRAHPGRFRAFITLPLPAVTESLRELERLQGLPEVVGITIGSNLGGLALSDRSLEPLWSRLNALRMPVFASLLEVCLTVTSGRCLEATL